MARKKKKKKKARQRQQQPKAVEQKNQEDEDFGLNPGDFSVGPDGAPMIGDFVVGSPQGIPVESLGEEEREFAKREAPAVGLEPEAVDDDEEEDEEEEEEITEEEEEDEEEEEEGKEETEEVEEEEESEEEDSGEEEEEEDVEEEGSEEEKTPFSFEIVHNGKEIVIEDEDEARALMQKGYDYDFKTKKLKEEHQALEPYMDLIQAVQSDPKLVDHIRKYGDEEYEIEVDAGKPPVVMTRQQYQAELMKQIELAIGIEKNRWTLEYENRGVEGIPTPEEVHRQMVMEATGWDASKRAYVESSPDAYNAEYNRIFQQMASDRGLTLNQTKGNDTGKPTREKGNRKSSGSNTKAIREKLRKKKAAKVESSHGGTDVDAESESKKKRLRRKTERFVKTGSIRDAGSAMEEILPADYFD